MKNSHVRAFWIGFVVTTALTAWIYWIWRQKRVVTPEPLILSGTRQPRPVQISESSDSAKRRLISEALEEINGIGPVFANRLNDAGIYTYAALASCTPEELQEITGVTRWDPADWIAEAKILAGTS
ncbi:MAG: hypothetical protein JSW55_19120 [Chloroflexota bacterium]|nr:MAG: hypothetical protein JSW55_19120 [Chloroflexota bacterium]